MRFYLLFAALAPFLAGAAVPKGHAADKPGHVILFVIDGLSYKAWDKLSIPTLRKLAKEHPDWSYRELGEAFGISGPRAYVIIKGKKA